MIGDALAGALTFSDTISGADDLPPEPVPGESGEKAARRPRRGQKRAAAPRVKRPAPAAGGRRPANATPTLAQIRDELLTYVELLALGATVRCAQCAGVVHDQAEPIASALAALAVRSPVALRVLRGSALLAESVELLTALRPVFVQVRAHHFVPPAEPQGGTPNGVPYAGSHNVPAGGGYTRYAPYPG